MSTTIPKCSRCGDASDDIELNSCDECNSDYCHECFSNGSEYVPNIDGMICKECVAKRASKKKK